MDWRLSTHGDPYRQKRDSGWRQRYLPRALKSSEGLAAGSGNSTVLAWVHVLWASTSPVGWPHLNSVGPYAQVVCDRQTFSSSVSVSVMLLCRAPTAVLLTLWSTDLWLLHHPSCCGCLQLVFFFTWVESKGFVLIMWNAYLLFGRRKMFACKLLHLYYSSKEGKRSLPEPLFFIEITGIYCTCWISPRTWISKGVLKYASWKVLVKVKEENSYLLRWLK